MTTTNWRGRFTVTIGSVLALVLAIMVVTPGESRAQVSLNVNLASETGPATGVGLGFLYGVTGDGSQPGDDLLQPLRMNAFRAGGHMTRGWIEDGYQRGPATQAVVDSVISQAQRFTRPPYQAHYQAILSDMYGAFGGQPAGTIYPCDNGNCSNWISFINSVVSSLQVSGLPIAYDIWNEPDISIFWERGVNSDQYFQMWDTAVREIRRIAPSATIVGPSFAFSPQGRPEQWQTWLTHTRTAATLPDMITNHILGDNDDPVAVAQATRAALTANGVSQRPLSANEYQPQNRLTANVTAWYLARLAQAGYDNAMRANWVCCLTPNLTGILTQTGGGWAPTGNYWVMRSYADLTGNLVATSGQVSGTAISAAKDSTNQRAVAVLGNLNGFTGAASVTFNGLSSAPWLAAGGSVHVTVNRFPEQAPLSQPQVVFEQDVSASGGSITVPLTFQAPQDAYAIYLIPGQTSPPPTTSSPPPPPPSTSPPPVPGGCAVNYQANNWGGSPGFTANVNITNNGSSTINGWQLVWNYTAGQTVTPPGWNGTVSQSGSTVTGTNASWNATIPPGGTVNIGFNGTAASVGNNPDPTSFTLNGTPCST